MSLHDSMRCKACNYRYSPVHGSSCDLEVSNAEDRNTSPNLRHISIRGFARAQPSDLPNVFPLPSVHERHCCSPLGIAFHNFFVTGTTIQLCCSTPVTDPHKLACAGHKFLNLALALRNKCMLSAQHATPDLPMFHMLPRSRRSWSLNQGQSLGTFVATT
ncbi:hypothetical protein HGRIS_014316 [Hohenbuehelia grisea]|uniref:Uncharacterized protein n=1 Tax=Hohenbuehelia grisea TaxID=104357 RepID=A0ABR3JUS7_9AGAR